MANEIARRLRKIATRQERKLWRFFRELKRQGFHFRRQVPIDGHVVDLSATTRNSLSRSMAEANHMEANCAAT